MSTQVDPFYRVRVGKPLKNAIRICKQAGINCLIIGHTGIGKTQIIMSLCEELNIHYCPIPSTSLEGVDFMGIPFRSEDRTEYARPSFFPVEGDGIIDLCEINRNQHVLNASLILLSERRIGDYRVPHGYIICASINDGPEYFTYQIDRSFRNRFLTIYAEANAHNWIEWARNNGIHPCIIGVVTFDPSVIELIPPRMLEYASKALHAMKPDEIVSDTVFDVLGGTFPAHLLKRIQSTISLAFDDIDPQEIVRGYHSSDVLKKTVKRFLAAGMLDALHRLAFQVATIVGGPKLAVLADQGLLSMVAINEFCRDLPGDLRERVMRSLHSNPLFQGLGRNYDRNS